MNVPHMAPLNPKGLIASNSSVNFNQINLESTICTFEVHSNRFASNFSIFLSRYIQYLSKTEAQVGTMKGPHSPRGARCFIN